MKIIWWTKENPPLRTNLAGFTRLGATYTECRYWPGFKPGQRYLHRATLAFSVSSVFDLFFGFQYFVKFGLQLSDQGKIYIQICRLHGVFFFIFAIIGHSHLGVVFNRRIWLG